MKTPEEIKEIRIVLECCSHDECKWESHECPYFDESSCTSIIARKSLAYINELEERISLMMIQMHGDCGVCKHRNKSAFQSPCAECTETKDNELWEYEGLPEVKHEKDQD